MKNTILVVGGVILAYVLYRKWVESKPKQEPNKPDAKVMVNEVIVKARQSNPRNSVPNNWEAFNLMHRDYNADESATVAPSIKAKIGIF